MAPRKGDTHEQKADRHIQQAATATQKGRYHRVVAALKLRPDVLADLERLLIGPGVISPQSQCADVSKEQPNSSPVKVVRARCEESGDGSSSGAAPEADADANWKRNVTKVGQVPPTHLMKALSEAEKSAFSGPYMKAITKRGQKSPPQEFMMQSLELMTNLDSQSPIDFANRSPSAFASWVAKLSDGLGRRGRDLVLQEAIQDWGPHGTFTATRVSECRVRVANRFTGASHLVAVDGSGEYFVDRNYSETNALLRDRNSDYKHALASIFQQQKGGAASKKNPKTGVKSPNKQEASEFDSGAGVAPGGLAMPVEPAHDSDVPLEPAKGQPEDKQTANERKRRAPASAAQLTAKLPRPTA